MKNTLILLGCFFLVQGLSGQDTLWLMNGKKKACSFVEFRDDLVFYTKAGQPDSKLKYYSKLDVFSIIRENGEEIITYKQDTTVGLFLTEREMQVYMEGQLLSHNQYKAPGVTIAGICVGVVGGIHPYLYVLPVIYSGIAGTMFPIPENKNYFPEDRLEDYFYINGFNEQARKKKTMNAIKGGVVGLGLTGVVILILSL